MLFKEKLPEFYQEVKESLLAEGEEILGNQIDNCVMKSCSSFASDNSAFIAFDGISSSEIEDSFPVGEKAYTVMVAYSKNRRIVGIDIIGCANTKLQKQLLACCT
jgi:hypothetical protein